MWGGRGGRGACACGGGGGGGGGGVILGEVKARPKDIISFSLDYISKSKVQTSNPSSSPISLDTPARPADYSDYSAVTNTSYHVLNKHVAALPDLRKRLLLWHFQELYPQSHQTAVAVTIK